MGRHFINPREKKVSLYVGIPGSLFRRMDPNILVVEYLEMGVLLKDFLRSIDIPSLPDFLEDVKKKDLAIDQNRKIIQAYDEMRKRCIANHPELESEMVLLY